MPTLFEPLECRALFSIASAAAAVQADVTALRSIATTALPTVKADVAAVQADAAALPKTPQNRKLIAAVKRDGARLTGQGTAAGTQLSAVVAKQQAGLVAAATAVALSPADAKAKAKLDALVKRAQEGTAGPIARLKTALTDDVTRLTADLVLIQAATPADSTLNADASRAQSDLATVAANARSQLSRTAADVQALVSALNG